MADDDKKDKKDKKETGSQDDKVEMTRGELATIMSTIEGAKAIIHEKKEKDSQIDQLRAEIDALKANSKPTVPVNPLKTITENRTVRLAFWQGKLIMGWANHARMKGRVSPVYQEINPSNRDERIEYIDLILWSGEKDKSGALVPEKDAVKVLYTEYMEFAEREKALILKVHKEMDVQNHGLTDKVEYVDWHAEVIGVKVSMEVSRWIVSFDLKLEDGREVTLPEEMVNI